MNENFQVTPHLQLHVIKLKPIPLRIPCRVERFTKNLSLVGRVSKLHLRVIVYIVFLSVGILNCALDNHLSKGISGISAAVHDREASPSHHPHLHLARHLHQSLSGNGHNFSHWEHIVKHPQLHWSAQRARLPRYILCRRQSWPAYKWRRKRAIFQKQILHGKGER